MTVEELKHQLTELLYQGKAKENVYCHNKVINKVHITREGQVHLVKEHISVNQRTTTQPARDSVSEMPKNHGGQES